MRKRVLVLSVSAVVVLGAVTAAGLLVFAPKIPPEISRQVSFVVTYPAADWMVSRDSFKFSDSSKVLTFTAEKGSVRLTIAEQPEPDPFKDIPNYMDKVTAQMAEYGSFDSAHGTVHLTRPASAGSKQVAVNDNQGTLTFVTASTDLDQDAWRRYFNTLQTTN